LLFFFFSVPVFAFLFFFPSRVKWARWRAFPSDRVIGQRNTAVSSPSFPFDPLCPPSASSFFDSFARSSGVQLLHQVGIGKSYRPLFSVFPLPWLFFFSFFAPPLPHGRNGYTRRSAPFLFRLDGRTSEGAPAFFHPLSGFTFFFFFFLVEIEKGHCLFRRGRAEVDGIILALFFFPFHMDHPSFFLPLHRKGWEGPSRPERC